MKNYKNVDPIMYADYVRRLCLDTHLVTVDAKVPPQISRDRSRSIYTRRNCRRIIPLMPNNRRACYNDKRVILVNLVSLRHGHWMLSTEYTSTQSLLFAYGYHRYIFIKGICIARIIYYLLAVCWNIQKSRYFMKIILLV